MKLPFISKKFIERRAYSALFDVHQPKRPPRYHKGERIKPRKTLTEVYQERLKRLDSQAARELREQQIIFDDHQAEASLIDYQERPRKTPWYKKRKLT